MADAPGLGPMANADIDTKNCKLGMARHVSPMPAIVCESMLDKAAYTPRNGSERCQPNVELSTAIKRSVGTMLTIASSSATSIISESTQPGSTVPLVWSATVL